MPTYSYRCKSCSYEFEELQRTTDKPLRSCPSCKKDTLARDIGSGSGLVFKGSGFYITDYGSPSSRDKKSSEKDKKKTPEQGVKKEESKTESPKTTSSVESKPTKSSDD